MTSRQFAGVVVLAGGAWLILKRRRSSMGNSVQSGPDILQQLADAVQGAVRPTYYAGAGQTPDARANVAQGAFYGPGSYVPGVAGAGYVDLTSQDTGDMLLRTGLGAGTTIGGSVLGAAVGPGTIAGALSSTALLSTGIGAGAGLLTWAIVQKGLFRGGEEALQVNPRRDAFAMQFGDTTWNPETSGFIKLSRILAEISAHETGGADNQKYEIALMRPLLQADTMEEFVPVTREIKALLATYGLDIESY